MASGMFMRLQAQQLPNKMYGFQTVDRDRERDIVARLRGSTVGSHRHSRPASAAAASGASDVGAENAADSDGGICGRYRTEPRPRRLLAAEDYSRALFARLGRSHTFSSRCKQRSLDPHRLCSRGAGESPDYAPIRDINVAEESPPPLTPADKQQQQQPSQGPSLSSVIGLSRMASRAAAAADASKSPERRQEAAKQRASPFGLVFRPAAKRDEDGGGGAEQTVASTAVFGALGRMRYRAKREELQQRERDQQARQLRSAWEIVNATEFVRGYEREKGRDMRLAVLGRPTVSSRLKGIKGVCPFCQEMPQLAAEWQEKLNVSGRGDSGEEAPAACQRCGESPKAEPSELSDAAGKEEAETAAGAAAAATWGKDEESALVSRLRAPTRASEGGVPFCRRGQEDAGAWLGSGLLGFEAQRPKSGLERVRSAQKRRELIDALSVRLHSGGGGGGDGGGDGDGGGGNRRAAGCRSTT